MSHDVIVVGGGIVGSALALRAAELGASVLALDNHQAGRATDAGAGIVSPATNTRDLDVWRELALAAAADYPHLAASLAGHGLDPLAYGQVGELVVALDDAEAAQLATIAAVIAGRDRDRGGVTAGPGQAVARGGQPPGSTHPVEHISPADAQALFPPLARPAAALYAHGAARVDGRLLTAGLRRAAAARGVTWQQATVQALCRRGDRVTGALVDGVERPAGAVAVAGGAWTAALVEPLGLAAATEPQRGQILHLRTGLAPTAGWPIVATVGDHYQVPWPDGRVAVGATRETGSGFDAAPTAGGVGEVLAAALRVSPGLAAAHLVEVRVGLRPLTADLLPVLGKIGAVEGLFVATGHGPTGLTLGPYSAALVAEAIAGLAPRHDLAPFSYERPALHGQPPVPAR